MKESQVEADAHAGDAPQELSVRDQLELQRLAALYWALADGVETVSIRDLFIDTGVLLLGSLRLDGAAAIEAFFREREVSQRGTSRITRHFATSFLATLLAPDRVRVRTNVIVFSGSGELPLEAGSPSGIADFEDLCVRTPQGWRYALRAGRTIFAGTGAPDFAR